MEPTPGPISTSLRRRCLVGLAVGVLAVVGAACSDDDTSAPTTSTSKAETSSATARPDDVTRKPKLVVIAHRGASAYEPEHTTASYDLARKQGADYLEQDLQLTADGELVVLHDPTLDRTTRGAAADCTGPVGQRTLAQVKTCDAGSWFDEAHPDQADPRHAGLRILTLDEVFQRYGDDARYYIEIKSPAEQPGIEGALLQAIDAADLAPDDERPRVVIQSFSGESLRQVHDADNGPPLVQLIPAAAGAPDAQALADIATYAGAVAPDHTLVDEAFVRAAHDACLDVHPWTVDDPADLDRLLDAGVDGIFTNHPDRLAAAHRRHDPPPVHCGGIADAPD